MRKNQFSNFLQIFAADPTGSRNEAVMGAEAKNAADIDGGADAGSGRNETRNEKRDRNWNDLLQELRVMQTGTQIIAGFLLTRPSNSGLPIWTPLQ